MADDVVTRDQQSFSALKWLQTCGNSVQSSIIQQVVFYFGIKSVVFAVFVVIAPNLVISRVHHTQNSSFENYDRVIIDSR